MKIPDNLHYTKEHEWIKFDQGVAIIGITDFAQGELGDIIFVELPAKDTSFNSGDSVGIIEAVKTVADIYTPLDGTILEINKNLEEEPELINKEPYTKGWILKLTNFSKDNANILSSKEYAKIIS